MQVQPPKHEPQQRNPFWGTGAGPAYPPHIMGGYE
jgi:hypothetical protein